MTPTKKNQKNKLNNWTPQPDGQLNNLQTPQLAPLKGPPKGHPPAFKAAKVQAKPARLRGANSDLSRFWAGILGFDYRNHPFWG